MPAISRNPPSASSANPPNPPWATAGSNGGTNMANSVWSSFFNDSDNDDVGQLSSGFAPTGGNSREDAMGFPRDDRRPSVASAMTVSSNGSKSSFSRGFHKKLQNVFGEDFPGDGRQNSDTSLNARSQITETQSLHAPRNRGNSLNNTMGSGGYHSRPASPTSLRPRTPQPSSEVTPWEYQEPQVSFCPRKERPSVIVNCFLRAISLHTLPSFVSLTVLGCSIFDGEWTQKVFGANINQVWSSRAQANFEATWAPTPSQQRREQDTT